MKKIVGPGTGNLTLALLNWKCKDNDGVKQVTAVEADPRMVTSLKQRLPQHFRGEKEETIEKEERKLIVIPSDILAFDFSSADPFDVCVSNVPYMISSPLLYKLMDLVIQQRRRREISLKHFVLLLQAEFAQRLYAPVGSNGYSRLTVNTQLQSDVVRLMNVEREFFKPPPKVDSEVVFIKPASARSVINRAVGKDISPTAVLELFAALKNGTVCERENYCNNVDIELAAQRAVVKEWDNMARLIFSRRNKTLRGIFKKKFSNTDVLELLQETGLEQSRARHLQQSELSHLFLTFLRAGVPFPSNT
eukprot:g3564.t1